MISMNQVVHDDGTEVLMKSPMLPMPYWLKANIANMPGSAAQKLETQIQNLAVDETFVSIWDETLQSLVKTQLIFV